MKSKKTKLKWPARLFYILKPDGKIVPVRDVLTWGRWFENSDELRRVRRDTIGRSLVSTVFLSLDHGWNNKAPVLWETKVFGGKLDGETTRCAGSREQAEAMHKKMVERVRRETRAERGKVKNANS